MEGAKVSMENQIKELAKKAGAALVGIASKDRLIGNECSDPTYVLPSAESVIVFAVPLDKEIIRNYLRKTDVSYKKKLSIMEGKTYHKLEEIGEAIKEFLESNGYEAVNCEVNMDYRYYVRIGRNQIDLLKQLIELGQKDPNDPFIQEIRQGAVKFYNPNLTPRMSHRYAGVACGIGRLGWSGNLMTKEHGACVYLSSVVTNAKLNPDPYLKDNPCTKCKVCVAACQSQFFDAAKSQTVKIGEVEEEVGKKHAISKCILLCGGFNGQSRFKKWSTWCPWRIDVPKDDEETDTLLERTLINYVLAGGLKAKNVLRLATDTQLGFGKAVKPVDDFDVTCGLCQFVCWETEEERRKNAKLLQSSGVVELGNEDKLIIRKNVEGN
jgi:epoxyqueuosine reductase QueG